MQLKDRIVLVTGAARRVGRAIALEFASKGCRVMVHYRSSESEAHDLVAEIVKRGGRADALRADLSQRIEVQSLIREIENRHGYVDVLVNNASEFFETPLLTTSDDDWDRMLRSNLTAPFWLARRVAPMMIERKCGVIVNIVDVQSEHYLDDHLAYCVSKAGLAMLTKGLARELAPHVRVVGVSPGPVVWPEHYSEAKRQAIENRVPLKRGGSAEDIACAVRFLVEEADFVTGEILNVDGGAAIA